MDITYLTKVDAFKHIGKPLHQSHGSFMFFLGPHTPYGPPKANAPGESDNERATNFSPGPRVPDIIPRCFHTFSTEPYITILHGATINQQLVQSPLIRVVVAYVSLLPPPKRLWDIINIDHVKRMKRWMVNLIETNV
jgi:hypothetical protein